MSADGMGSAGSIAEESISTIRTAKAFGIQANLAGLFGDKVDQAGKCDMKLAVAQGLGFAAFFFVSYASYGLGKPSVHLNHQHVWLIISSIFFWNNAH